METAGPITIGEYVYYLGSRNMKKVYVKAIRVSDQSEYTGRIKSNNDYLVFWDVVDILNVYSAKTQKGVDINTLSDPVFAGKVFFTNNYDDKKDIIKIICGPMGFIGMSSYSFELHKYINHRKITANRFEKHEYLLGDLIENNNKQIAKISELEKIILTMREEISSLKEETANSKYFVNLEPLVCADGVSSNIIDIKKIKSIQISGSGKGKISISVQSRKKCYNMSHKGFLDAELMELQKALEVLNKLKYVKSISFYNYDMELPGGKDIYSYMDKCENVTEIFISCCKNIKSIPGPNVFPKLIQITISGSPNIKNLDILKQYESLKFLNIDKKSENGYKWDGVNFRVNHFGL
jgi:hypothetical protein